MALHFTKIFTFVGIAKSKKMIKIFKLEIICLCAAHPHRLLIPNNAATAITLLRRDIFSSEGTRKTNYLDFKICHLLFNEVLLVRSSNLPSIIDWIILTCQNQLILKRVETPPFTISSNLRRDNIASKSPWKTQKVLKTRDDRQG